MGIGINELRKMNDMDLYNCVSSYLNTRFEKMNYNMWQFLDVYNEKQFYFAVANLYCTDIQNIDGGLYTFLLEENLREVLPYLLTALNEVGAYSYAKQLKRYVEKKKIDINNIDNFIKEQESIRSVFGNGLDVLVELLEFYDLNMGFEEMMKREPYKDILIQYVRNNIDNFEIKET